jgi:hypothetical protein
MSIFPAFLPKRAVAALATIGVLAAVGVSAGPTGVATANPSGVSTPPGDQVFDYNLCGQVMGHRCGPLFDPAGAGSPID